MNTRLYVFRIDETEEWNILTPGLTKNTPTSIPGPHAVATIKAPSTAKVGPWNVLVLDVK